MNMNDLKNMKFAVRLAGEVVDGLDGEPCLFRTRDEAERAARELEHVWRRELRGEALEVREIR
jgi:hypothetical protein